MEEINQDNFQKNKKKKEFDFFNWVMGAGAVLIFLFVAWWIFIMIAYSNF